MTEETYGIDHAERRARRFLIPRQKHKILVRQDVTVIETAEH